MLFEADNVMFEIYRETEYTGRYRVVYFTDRVISPEGERLNFTAEFGAGAQMTLTDRLGLRAGYSLFHVSNGDRGRRNPGLDTNMIYVAAVFELRPKARR